MRLRALAVTTALALAVTGLSACTSKIGQAASVGGQGITQKDVDRYVNPAGPSASALAQQQGQAIAPRVLVVNTLIRQQLLVDALKRITGATPSGAQLRAKYAEAVSQISGGQASPGAAFDATLRKQLTSLGFRVSFAPVYLRTAELLSVLVDRVGAKSDTDLLAAIAKSNDKVSVSPRYGAWSAKDFALSNSATAGLPSFVTVGPDTAVAAGSTGAATGQ